ncbi:MAG TPA: MaoC/PaaZ C-terminal domain-containing protein [Chloroflexota bacterium]|nr:MaoC/PaaZ C-terminal domain-containing protein [Chloroflexota bacterium]
MSVDAKPAWAVGTELGPLVLAPVTRLDLIKYAGASGDFNPIHTIDAAASEAGLPGVIQHGMLTMARVGLLFSPHLESGFISLIEVRFAGMVAVGDVLTVGGRLTEIVNRDEDQVVLIEVSVRNQRDQLVLGGQVEFKLFASG